MIEVEPAGLPENQREAQFQLRHLRRFEDPEEPEGSNFRCCTWCCGWPTSLAVSDSIWYHVCPVIGLVGHLGL